MSFNKLKFYFYRFVYSRLKHTKLMTQNMKSPNNGFLGNIAKYLMVNFNKIIIYDSVKKLNIKKNDKVIEIGSGNGQAIDEMLKLTKQNITSIEVSEKFRTELIKKFHNKDVTFFSNDAKDLNGIFKNNTFNKLLAVNVVYFLTPLNVYANEFYRILKMDGEGLLACKFDGIKKFDNSTAPNRDLKDVVKVFQNAGFKVNIEFVDSNNEQEKYHLIFIRKLKNGK
ncbi:class I SAM-dependent methyltransferase [Alphaproteobacteria bacterium]|nr:class I SAM-dependent methyltransferase [Alphaproteobacteria bacterium]